MFAVPLTDRPSTNIADQVMDFEMRNVETTSPLIREFHAEERPLTELRVDTEFGPVLVALQGVDHRLFPSRPVILTYPDLGLNHVTNFQSFFANQDMQLLVQSFSVLHVDPPGQEEGAGNLPEGFTYPSMDQLAQQLETVCKFLSVRSVIGFGVGLGANVLTRFALKFPGLVEGLFLINATAGAASWTEWFYQVSCCHRIQLFFLHSDLFLLLRK